MQTNISSSTLKISRVAMIRLPIPAPSTKERKQVAFNDDELAEHDRDRGTRMKITEPDTPFMRSPILSDDEAEDSPTHTATGIETLSADVFLDRPGSPSIQALKHQEFLAKRKAFYKEFEAAKQRKSNLTADSDDSEDISPSSFTAHN